MPEAALPPGELGHGQPAAVRAEFDEGRVARQLPGQPAGGDLPHLDVLAFPGRRGDPAAVGADRTLVEAPVGTEPGDLGRLGNIQHDGLGSGRVVDHHVPTRAVPRVMACVEALRRAEESGRTDLEPDLGPVAGGPERPDAGARRRSKLRVRRCEPSGLNWAAAPTASRGRWATGLPVDGSQSRTPSVSDEASRRPSGLKSMAWGPQLSGRGVRLPTMPWCSARHSRPSASSQSPKPARSPATPLAGHQGRSGTTPAGTVTRLVPRTGSHTRMATVPG